jgi:hypothetical protein
MEVLLDDPRVDPAVDDNTPILNSSRHAGGAMRLLLTHPRDFSLYRQYSFIKSSLYHMYTIVTIL